MAPRHYEVSRENALQRVFPSLSLNCPQLQPRSTVQDGMMKSWREKGYVPDSDEEDEEFESQAKSNNGNEQFLDAGLEGPTGGTVRAEEEEKEEVGTFFHTDKKSQTVEILTKIKDKQIKETTPKPLTTQVSSSQQQNVPTASNGPETLEPETPKPKPEDLAPTIDSPKSDAPTLDTNVDLINHHHDPMELDDHLADGEKTPTQKEQFLPNSVDQPELPVADGETTPACASLWP